MSSKTIVEIQSQRLYNTKKNRERQALPDYLKKWKDADKRLKHPKFRTVRDIRG